MENDMKSKFLREIRANLEYMSTVERRIAETILSDPQNAVKSSLSELSEQANVSQGSVVNFANKFCGGGFSAMKLEIASSLSNDEKQPYSAVAGTDSMGDILKKTVGSISDALTNTSALNEENALRTAAEMILKAKKVEIYGVFRSAVVATDLYYQLIQLSIPANFVSDVLTCAISASMLRNDSLVIAISSSGETQDVIDAVKLAKANNVPVICITAHKNSHLAKLSDIILVAAPGGNSLSANDNEIRISQLAITDTLCSYIRSKLDSDGENGYFKVKSILSMHNVRD